MRQMLQGFINQLLSVQADTVCGAEYGVVSTATGIATATLTPVWARSTWQYRMRHGAFFPSLAVSASHTSRTGLDRL